MPYEKICAYESCGKPFTTRQQKVRYHSQSCASKDRVRSNPSDIREYLLKYIEMPTNPNRDCWIWTGNIKKGSGYGIACVRNTRIYAHRLVYEIFVGPLPAHLYILHGNTCHSRACVNPSHLRLGTHIDNMHDKRDWGAQPRGEDHYASTMSETQVLHILKAFHEQGQKIVQIARWRRIHIATVQDIIARRTWAHVAPGLYPPPQDQRRTLTPTHVREMRALHDQQDWSYQAITTHMNRIYPTLDLLYDTTIDVCTYRTWVNLPATPEPEAVALPQSAIGLDIGAVQAMRQAYASACDEAETHGMRVKITHFARPYAKTHGISNMAVRLILKGQTWKHVTP